MLAPTWFGIVILIAFAAFNIFRSVAILILGVPQDPNAPNPYQVAAVIVFLGTGLGIGFTVFWMSSSQIHMMLEQLANTDPLTGIHNRRSFITFCEREILRCSRSGGPLSLIMLDIDHFKQINDRYGHSTGDAVLCAVVEKLRDSVRNVDVVGRWGGEEFVALLPGADSHAAQLVAQRIRSKVESLTMTKSRTRAASATATDTRIPVTISLGVTTYLGSNDSIDELLDRCDQAMYQAKSEGRNRVV
jgi:diguanylate cyclase (GGDEF)-like protein